MIKVKEVKLKPIEETLVCRHENFRSVCKNCVEEYKRMRDVSNALRNREVLYKIEILGEGLISKPDKTTPFLQRIKKEVKKLEKSGKLENEFVVPLIPEDLMEAIKSRNGDEIIVRFYNQFLCVSLRAQIADLERKIRVGIVCRIRKIFGGGPRP